MDSEIAMLQSVKSDQIENFKRFRKKTSFDKQRPDSYFEQHTQLNKQMSLKDYQ